MNQIDPELQFFGSSVEADMKLEDLAQFLGVVDGFLRESANRLSGETDGMGLDLSYAFAEPLPEILYASFITSVVSFLEREAQGFAHVLRRATDAPLGMAELSGAWYDRFRKFCEKLAGLDLGLTEIDWANLRGIVEVRNCLVHSGGQLSNFRGRANVEQFLARQGLPSPEEELLRADLQLSEVTLALTKACIDSMYRAALGKFPRTE